MREMKPATFFFGIGAALVSITMLGVALPEQCKVVPPIPTPSPTVAPSPTPSPVPTATPTPAPPVGCSCADTNDESAWVLERERPTDEGLITALNEEMRAASLLALGLPPDSDRCWIGQDGACPAPPRFVEALVARMQARGYCALARGDDTIGISRVRCGSWHADVITGAGSVLWQRHKETFFWSVRDCDEPGVPPTPIPTATPGPTSSPTDPIATACGLPTPPPLDSIACGWLYGQVSGILDCTPQVYGCGQEPNYCELIGLGTMPDGVTRRCHCPPRSEGQPEQRDACIALITGGSVWNGPGNLWPDDGGEPNQWMWRTAGGIVKVCSVLHSDICNEMAQ